MPDRRLGHTTNNLVTDSRVERQRPRQIGHSQADVQRSHPNTSIVCVYHAAQWVLVAISYFWRFGWIKAWLPLVAFDKISKAVSHEVSNEIHSGVTIDIQNFKAAIL